MIIKLRNTMYNSLTLIALVFTLLSCTLSTCIPNCLTCQSPSPPGNSQCLSCFPNAFVLNQTCYLCSLCNLKNACHLCPLTNQNQKDQGFTYEIMFGGLFAVCFFIIVICKKCNNQDKIVHVAKLKPLPIDKNTRWQRGQNQIKKQEICSICLEDAVYLQTKCRHPYHPECLKQWIFEREISCPLCKSVDLNPLKLYCRQCHTNYIQIQLNSLPFIARTHYWQICNDCKDMSTISFLG